MLLVLLVAAASLLPFNKSLSETERFLLDFVVADLKIKERQVTRLIKNVRGPFDFKVKHTKTLDDKVTQIDYTDNSLSLTIIGDDARMAIINGELVKEGDMLEGMQIQKIEPERVLINNKNAKWLYLEKTK